MTHLLIYTSTGTVSNFYVEQIVTGAPTMIYIQKTRMSSELI
jgi:hypothetical protein